MEAFPNYQIGYSDHTIGIDAVLAAVALGATVIEKHFTLAKTLPGTDHIVSATPEELAEMVRRIRRIELLLGSGVKAPVLREQAVRELVRRRWKKAQRSGV
jgi:sialic acid synthase SpsE